MTSAFHRLGNMLRPRVAYAQTPPATFYGRGLRPGALVTAELDGRPVGSQAVVNDQGEWVIAIQSNDSSRPTQGSTVTFAVDGERMEPPATWQGGGFPDDLEWGLVLRPAQAPTAKD